MWKNKIIVLVIAVLAIGALGARSAEANGGDDHTVAEEAAGKEIWNKLQAKTVSCGDLTDDDLGALGEYFMGTMLGEAHAGMNQMMTTMMGEEGERQMHVVMGKRLSGCDTAAVYPPGGFGFMPMMGPYGMMGVGSGMMGGWNAGSNPMSLGGFGSWLVMLAWIVWFIVGLLAAVWFWRQINKK